jgi:hypothetical protein
MRRAASLLVALVVAACSEPPAPPGGNRSPSATVASSHAPPSVLQPGAFAPGSERSARLAPSATARPPIAPSPVQIGVVPFSAREGEDGHGNTVRALRPAAIDLVTAVGWHAGGLATTLTVGDLRFHNMGYPSITTMRFVVADLGALPRDAEVALEVGGPSGRRRVLASSLPVTR